MYANRYKTLSDARNALKNQGYSRRFFFTGGQLMDSSTHKRYAHTELQIKEYHRFRGITNPSGSSIVFALETRRGTKGTLVMSYGSNVDMDLISFLDKIPIRRRERRSK